MFKLIDTVMRMLRGSARVRLALNSASTPKEVRDLQARIAAEQAMINNDQMQLQGLGLLQGPHLGGQGLDVSENLGT